MVASKNYLAYTLVTKFKIKYVSNGDLIIMLWNLECPKDFHGAYSSY